MCLALLRSHICCRVLRSDGAGRRAKARFAIGIHMCRRVLRADIKTEKGEDMTYKEMYEAALKNLAPMKHSDDFSSGTVSALIEGANGEWQKGTEDGLSFTSNAAFAHYLKVQVDSKDLDASNYTVKEGSTIVTLKASYLETLSVGKHTLAIVSETGTATTEFTIKAAAVVNDDTESPQTGDSSNMMMWVALLTASGAALLVLGVYTKKRRFVKR